MNSRMELNSQPNLNYVGITDPQLTRPALSLYLTARGLMNCAHSFCLPSEDFHERWDVCE